MTFARSLFAAALAATCFTAPAMAQITVDNGQHHPAPRVEIPPTVATPGEPTFFGIEVGSGLTMWEHATPTYFATTYPYTNGSPDTIHVPFTTGFTPLFGWFAGISADIWYSEHWGLLAKLNYNERRGNWKETSPTEADINGVSTAVPVTNDLTYMLRDLSLEAYAKYRLPALSGLYLGAGLAATGIIYDHYDLDQTIDAGSNVSFRNLSTGQATGIQTYGVGNSLGNQHVFLEAKLLAGMPFSLGAESRWTINPELTLGVPLTSIWSSDARASYQANGIPSPIEPLTITGLLAFRYRYR